ncbi:MAG: SGNH/GDSL hydrolase family protein [Thermoflexales bacterium]|nr:SGNH/GDSL hydrolase family protein [Thermoflexales bacterium]
MNRLTLHVVGDSISIHYGPYLQTMLAGVMVYSRKTAPDGSLDDAGAANGGDSSLVLAYLQSLQPVHKFDVLLINCSLHDIKRDLVTNQPQVPTDHYAANLQTILIEGQRLAKHTMWVRTTPVIDERHNRLNTAFRRFEVDVETYNAYADNIMREHGIPIIDLFTFTRNLGPDVYADHVHFTDQVRAQQAAFIAGHLYQGAA